MSYQDDIDWLANRLSRAGRIDDHPQLTQESSIERAASQPQQGQAAQA